MSSWIPFLTQLCDVADDIALTYFNQSNLDIDIKDNMTPVSAGDLAIENEIRALVKSQHPHLSIIGEEYGETLADSNIKLIIDPIDGTKNFIRGLPFFGSLFAIEDDGHVVAGRFQAALKTLVGIPGTRLFLMAPRFIAQLSRAYQKPMDLWEFVWIRSINNP